jgi:hypothetical protein
MRYRALIVRKTNSYTLTHYIDTKSRKRYYVVSLTAINLWDGIDKIDQHFNPHGNRNINTSHYSSWKFKSKTEAEELLSLAILKGLL